MSVDAVFVLTVYLFLLFGLPARLVFPAFGGAGSPASLFGVALATAWLWSRTSPHLMIRDRQPLRLALLLYGLLLFGSFIAGVARGMPAEEARSAGRFFLATASIMGVGLTVADLIDSRNRLDVLLLRLVYGGAFLAFLGVLQFFFGIEIASRIRVPGLRPNRELLGIAARGDIDLRRVAATANHYIEFGVVLALILPIALHYALHSPSRQRSFYRWGAVVTIGIAIPFSISRSAVLAAAVVLSVLVVAWTARMKLNSCFVLLTFLVCMRAAVPGLLGTVKSLFLNASNDPSVTGRTDDYDEVFRYIGERRWFGRGTGTFMPERYILLDNQLLGSLAATGILGTLALAGVFIVGIQLNGRARRNTHDPVTHHLTFALTAAIVGSVVASFTFDSLSFSMHTGVLFVMIGASGALWRLARSEEPTPLTRPRPELLKRWRPSEEMSG